MKLIFLSIKKLQSVSALALAVVIAGCGGSATAPVTLLSVSVATSPIVAAQDGTPAVAQVSITSANTSANVTVTGLPSGVQTQYAATNSTAGPSGTVTFTSNATVPSGNYSGTLTVNSGGQVAATYFTLTVAAVARVGPSTDTSLGMNGVLRQFMSTSFQIAEWTGNFFGTGALATGRENTLTAMGPQHVRMQPVSEAIPMKANSGAASDWDFSLLDQTLQPILASADHSPELQVATAPAWMCLSNGQLDLAHHTKDFADYAANLVRYYNKGGFTWGGTHFQSPGSNPIPWWGIFNEYNLNGMTPSEYISLYNTVVPEMLAVDPTIKISALEFSGYGLGSGGAGDPMLMMPLFAAPAGSGGVNAQVDVLSTHFYATCSHQETDASLFNQIPQFVAIVKYFYQELETRPDLAAIPVWVTENNVNSDYTDANGNSTCDPAQKFVTDVRGTNAFFAAWRPYVFSQLGKAGNESLNHWTYSGDQQFGEVDGNGNPYLSYWVDKTLAALYAPTATLQAPKILALNATDTSTVETLATEDSDGKVIVMVVDRAADAANPNNGPGDPRTVVVDLSSLGGFSAASVLKIDSSTNVATGPVGTAVAPSQRISIALNGYGVAWLMLTP